MYVTQSVTFGLFFHIFAPTTKALFKMFMILKTTVGLLWNSVKVDSIKYSTVP